MENTKYIFTVDAGRSNLHMALYQYDLGSCFAPQRIKDYRDVPNKVYDSKSTRLLTERIDETVGCVRQALHDLPVDAKKNLAIVLDSHGAAGIVLDKAGNPLFQQVYDHSYSPNVRRKFHDICGSQDDLYLETATPMLAKGINWIVQIVDHLERNCKIDGVSGIDNIRCAGSISSVAGYVAGRLLDVSVPTDWTHVANHGYAADVRGSDLKLSSVFRKLKTHYGVDVSRLVKNARKEAYLPVGKLSKNNEFGIAEGAEIFSIAHDTSLVSELARMAGFSSFDNSGTWSCLISPGRKPTIKSHMQQWDFVVNAGIYGEHLPTAMFRGGQMWAGYMDQAGAKGFKTDFDMDTFRKILNINEGIFVRPAYMDGFGPYKHKTKTPNVNPALLSDYKTLAHAVELSLALQTVFAEAAATRDLSHGTSIVDLLNSPEGDKMLLAGPARKGLTGDVLGLVMPKDIFTVEDGTPVNLTGALIAAAYFEGKKPDEINFENLPVQKRKTIPKDDDLQKAILEYAGEYDKWARSMPD